MEVLVAHVGGAVFADDDILEIDDSVVAVGAGLEGYITGTVGSGAGRSKDCIAIEIVAT